MGFSCGIVGLPNVGKSTLFNALTESGVEASNYPFCTIDPNVGIVNVPDPRLDKISEIAQSLKVVPTTMEFVDIAGLVKGAAQGEGLGNQFLANIRNVQAIAHVVRCFQNDNVIHVHGDVDPLRDIEVIETELILRDLDTVEKRKETVSKRLKANEKAAKEEIALLDRLSAFLADGKLAKNFEADDKEKAFMSEYHLLTAKPVMYVANTDEAGVRDGNAMLDKVKQHAESQGAAFVPICADIESQLIELGDEDREMFLSEMGMTEPGLNRMIQQGYELLGLQTYFTSGPKESRAWTYRFGAKAPQAAGIIHTDFERGFIRAEVMKFDDLMRLGSESAVKEAGLYKVEGKEYVVQDGDIIFFRFNV